ncbi:hypothetical protein PPYR_12517 [Photinus pyralis]|uniref:Protein sleepless n=1 Tax=Photinus pyralis TaxID=7054 RepID=A0A5N4A6E8_PHOPY|nr:hypothetical protein PPYR_12517 [Photinus pyralis]
MVSVHCMWLICLIYLGQTVDEGESILCYVCDSMNNPLCNDPFNMSAIAVSNCTNENFACLKREKYDKGINSTSLHRGCIQKHFCEVLAKASEFCYTCTSDYCNSSFRTIALCPLYLFVIIVSLLFK